MRAYLLERYGDAGGARLTDVPDPGPPRPGEVQVAIRAAGLNPVDFKFREGKLRAILRPTLPVILGNEIAGEVVATGAGVADLRPGERVFARLAKDSGGAFAERVNVERRILAASPATLDDQTAAGVPLAGLTALQALRDVLRVQPGQRVLISGGAGGVGTFAIQLARWMGAHITTTASPRGTALVRSLGADDVIDYTTERLADRPRDFDAGFDLIGGDTLTDMLGLVREGGTVVSVAGPPEPQTALQDLDAGRGMAALFWVASVGIRGRARRAGVGYRFLFMRPDGDGLTLLARLIDAGDIRVVIDRVFPFGEIAEAMAYLESGRAKGKVVVTMT